MAQDSTIQDERASAVAGGCLCGAVSFEIELPTIFCGHCHCSMCRRPHGASYVTWVGVPPAQFRITAGESALRTFDSSELGRRQFCARCGSQLFCWHERVDGQPARLIDVTLASLQGPIDRLPEGHYYFDSGAEWTAIADDLPRFGGDTGTEPLS